MVTHRKVWGIVLAVLLLILSACGGDDEVGGSALEGVSRDATHTPVPTTVADSAAPLGGVPDPAPGTLGLPDIPMLDAQIVFIRESTLYLATFDGQAPAILAEEVSAPSVNVSPGDDIVAYSVNSPELRETYGITVDAYDLRLTDLRTLDTTIYVPEASTPSPRPVLGWLADGATAVSWDNNAWAAVLVNATDTTLTPIPGPFGVAWTPEGHLLHVGVKPGTENDNPRVGTVFEVDPTSGNSTMYDFTLITPPEMDFLNLEVGLREQGVTYAESYTQQARSVLLDDSTRALVIYPEAVEVRHQPRICDTWQIIGRARDGSAPDISLYTASDTAYLTDLTALPDGSLLFLRWYVPDCDITADMTLDLLRLVPGEDATALATGLDPGAQGGFSALQGLSVERGRKYDVSPDGRYVVWIGGGRTTELSTLHIIDLETGDSAPLMSLLVEPSGAGSIETVFWAIP